MDRPTELDQMLEQSKHEVETRSQEEVEADFWEAQRVAEQVFKTSSQNSRKEFHRDAHELKERFRKDRGHHQAVKGEFIRNRQHVSDSDSRIVERLEDSPHQDILNELKSYLDTQKE